MLTYVLLCLTDIGGSQADRWLTLTRFNLGSVSQTSGLVDPEGKLTTVEAATGGAQYSFQDPRHEILLS